MHLRSTGHAPWRGLSALHTQFETLRRTEVVATSKRAAGVTALIMRLSSYRSTKLSPWQCFRVADRSFSLPKHPPSRVSQVSSSLCQVYDEYRKERGTRTFGAYPPVHRYGSALLLCFAPRPHSGSLCTPHFSLPASTRLSPHCHRTTLPIIRPNPLAPSSPQRYVSQ